MPTTWLSDLPRTGAASLPLRSMTHLSDLLISMSHQRAKFTSLPVRLGKGRLPLRGCSSIQCRHIVAVQDIKWMRASYRAKIMTPDKSKTMDAAEKLMLDLMEIRHNGSLRGNPRRRVRILSRKKLNSAVSTRLLSAMVTGLGLPSALSRRFRYSAGLTRSSSAPLPK
jgi:hypothetical protein